MLQAEVFILGMVWGWLPLKKLKVTFFVQTPLLVSPKYLQLPPPKVKSRLNTVQAGLRMIGSSLFRFAHTLSNFVFSLNDDAASA